MIIIEFNPHITKHFTEAQLRGFIKSTLGKDLMDGNDGEKHIIRRPAARKNFLQLGFYVSSNVTGQVRQTVVKKLQEGINKDLATNSTLYDTATIPERFRMILGNRPEFVVTTKPIPAPETRLC